MKYAIRTVIATVSIIATVAYATSSTNDQPDHMAALIELQYDIMSDCEKTRGDAETQPEPCEDWPK